MASPSIAIEFEADADADKKYDEVTREVNALRPELPPDIAQLEIQQDQPGPGEHRRARAGFRRTRPTASSKTARAT